MSPTEQRSEKGSRLQAKSSRQYDRPKGAVKASRDGDERVEENKQAKRGHVQAKNANDDFRCRIFFFLSGDACGSRRIGEVRSYVKK